LTSLVGAIQYKRKKMINIKAALVFAVPALIAVFLTRLLLVPAIPETLFSIFDFQITKQIFIMLLFAFLMLMAAISMIKNKKADTSDTELDFNISLIVIEGFVVGVLTGLVGAGGGFLIIPALVILAKLPMRMAVGTSLVIIATKSLIGFLGDIGANMEIDWYILAGFSFFAVGGIFVGSHLSKYISSSKLKPLFGWFVLVMAIYIIGKEIITNKYI
ncbi:MAG: sulfite exporter TauE/SafE family protein, partial [Melioribacteraceae bacterium]|nr:sulfite exporter TauE/SafE family protein [Melioribacteraceae bacterium]